MRSTLALGIAAFALSASLLFHFLPLFYMEAQGIEESTGDRPQTLWTYGMVLRGMDDSTWWGPSGDGYAADDEGYMRAAGVFGAFATITFAVWLLFELRARRGLVGDSDWRRPTALIAVIFQAMSFFLVRLGVDAVSGTVGELYGAQVVAQNSTPVQLFVLIGLAVTALFWATDATLDYLALRAEAAAPVTEVAETPAQELH